MKEGQNPILSRGAGLLLAALIFGSSGCRRPAPSLPTVQLTVGEIRVAAEVADDPGTRERGLMGRRVLDKDSGMLFVFPRPVRNGFWMKDTLIPLSIAFINRHGLVIEIREMIPDDGSASYVPAASYLYALEMPGGWFEEHCLQPGVMVRGLSGLAEAAR